MRLSFLLALLVCAVEGALPCPAHAFEPGPSSPRPADMGLAPLPQDEYAESLTYVAYLADGSRAEAGFQVSNLGLGKDNASFNAEIVIGGKVWHMRDTVKHRYKWTAAPESIEMGEAGKSQHWIRLRTLTGEAGQAGHVVEISAGCPEFSFRLRFRSLVPAWRPGSGQVRFGDRVLQFLVQVPRAQVTGQLVVAGKTVPTSGRGYVEHGRTNVDPRRLTERQLRLRYFDEIDGQPLTVLAFDQLTTPKDGSRRFGFLVAFLGSQVVYQSLGPVLQPLGLTPDQQRRQNLLPTEYRVSLGQEVEILAKVAGLVERSDYLDELSGFLRLVLRHFIHPISYNYDCSADVNLHLPGLTTKRHGWADCGISLTRP